MTDRLHRAGKSLRRQAQPRPRPAGMGVLRPALNDGPDLGRATLHALERRFQEALRLEERGATHVGGVHERRVALRRLRAALQLAGLRGDARRAHALLTALGQVRDLQLQVESVVAAPDELAAELHRRARDLAAASRAWCEEGAPRLAPRLQALAARGLAAGQVRRQIERDATKLARLLGALEPELPPEHAHRARTAARHLRDDVEAVGAGHFDTAATLLPRLVALQTDLGGLHDHDLGHTGLRETERSALVARARRTMKGCADPLRRFRAELGFEAARA